jgi:TolB-like protein
MTKIARLRRFRVLRVFSVKRRVLTLGTVFDVELGDVARKFGGQFFMRGTARRDGFDFSGIQLTSLVENEYLEELRRELGT